MLKSKTRVCLPTCRREHAVPGSVLQGDGAEAEQFKCVFHSSRVSEAGVLSSKYGQAAFTCILASTCSPACPSHRNPLASLRAEADKPMPGVHHTAWHAEEHAASRSGKVGGGPPGPPPAPTKLPNLQPVLGPQANRRQGEQEQVLSSSTPLPSVQGSFAVAITMVPPQARLVGVGHRLAAPLLPCHQGQCAKTRFAPRVPT